MRLSGLPLLAATVFIGLALPAGAVAAEPYPAKPIRVVVIAQFIRGEIAKWAKVVAQSGFKADWSKLVEALAGASPAN